MKKNCILFAGERKGRIFTPVITTRTTTMKTFESHQTFENQDLKVEINFFGLVKVTEKEDGTSKVKNDNTAAALKYWTKYFNEESKRGNHQVR